jgi:uncharacterized membrane protein YbhN (UPF0104 family)
MPMRGGDLVLVEYLSRTSGESRPTILGTEIVDRWFQCWGWFGPLLLLSSFGILPLWLSRTALVIAGGLGVWAVAMIVLARRRGDNPARSRVATALASFRAGIATCRLHRVLLVAFFIAPLASIWEAAVILVSLRGFGVALSYPKAFSVLVSFNVATVLPAPGAVGPTEAGGATALALFGVNRSAALAFMVVYHLTQLIPTIAAGLVIMLTARLRRRTSSSPKVAAPAPVAAGLST